MRIVFALALLFCSPTLFAQIEVEKPWSRATAPGAKVAAGYLLIRNQSATPERLLSASSPLARKTETHVTYRDGDVMRMREVKGYDIPAKGSFELRPGGAHLMLVDIRQQFREGDRVPLTLKFEKAGELQVELVVSRAAPGAHGGHMKH